MLRILTTLVISLLLSTSAAAAATDTWIPISEVGTIQLQVDTSLFTYNTTVNGTMYVNGEFRMLDSSTPDLNVSKFWLNTTSCSERGGTLNSILIPGSKTTFRPWSASGNTLFDVVGITLCKYHVAVLNVIRDKQKKKKDSI